MKKIYNIYNYELKKKNNLYIQNTQKITDKEIEKRVQTILNNILKSISH